jgi:hypothetical protein
VGAAVYALLAVVALQLLKLGSDRSRAV